MGKLHIGTAVIEAGAGFALTCWPSATVTLLLGSGLDAPAAVAVGRVAGVALLALGVACWLAHYDAQSRAARGLIGAMAVYNVGVVVILITADVVSRTVGIALWPAVLLHAVMAIWCVAYLSRVREQIT